MDLRHLICFYFIAIMLVVIDACMPQEVSEHNSTISRNIEVPDKVDFIFHIKPILSDRCFKCHGPDEAKVEAKLQLHTEEKAFAALGNNGDRFAIKAYDVEQSQIIHRIYSNDPAEIMPPPESNLFLSEVEKKLIRKWIEQGAEWKEHWAFAPVQDPVTPSIHIDNWISNPIDNFIVSRLEQQNLKPSPLLRPEKLLRKVSFDLTGLPPDLDDIESFLKDSSVEHYNQIVDRYLASDAYAEHMTNQWLDLARYADTHGYQDDLERIMWPWRDWVIHAFARNMPYDQFVTWQLAGDLLPNASKEQIIATAFNRNHKITQEGGVIPEEYRVEYVSDRTNTFGTAFLGLTFECAKCHDHKYDPISQKEYYQLFGFFNSVDEKGLIEDYGAIPEPYINLTKDDINGIVSFINNIDEADTIPLMIMRDLEKERPTHILERGLYNQLGEQVQPAIPGFGKTSKVSTATNRLELANWLFGQENPLTARVTVNRLWQQIFGQGIVASSYDFGNQGSLPTHPELLDHLAAKFRNEGWDVASLVKYMVTSSTYKQESATNEKLLEVDPENKLLARSSRTRLSAEMLRDHTLSISGLLVRELGGPSVKPYQPEGLWNEVAGGGTITNYVQDDGDKNYRRSLYTYWKRTVPPPNMLLFDAPTRDLCMVKRENTSTPLQSLVLMNDPQFLEASKALAHRAVSQLNSESYTDEAKIIQYMFTLATSRQADADELLMLVRLYQEQVKHYNDNSDEADRLLGYGQYKITSDEKTPRLAAFSFVANAILNLDETISKT